MGPPPYDVAEVLAGTRVLLLDFDGPVCGVFGGIPDRAIADQLRPLIEPLPPGAATTNDPLEVLRAIGLLGEHSLTERVEDALCRWELEATKTATPTPFAAEALAAAHAAGRSMVMVSNNSAEAVEAYLRAHRLEKYVRATIGRSPARPELMKPHPDPVRRATAAVRAEPSACVLLGDSLTDIQAARAAGIRSIGYANKPHKRRLLIDAGADALIEGADGMAVIASTLAMLSRSGARARHTGEGSMG